MVIDLLEVCTEERRNVWRRGTVGGGASTIWINERDTAVEIASWAWLTTSYVPRRGDANIGSDLDLEWKFGVNGVVSDEIHCPLG